MYIYNKFFSVCMPLYEYQWYILSLHSAIFRIDNSNLGLDDWAVLPNEMVQLMMKTRLDTI